MHLIKKKNMVIYGRKEYQLCRSLKKVLQTTKCKAKAVLMLCCRKPCSSGGMMIVIIFHNYAVICISLSFLQKGRRNKRSRHIIEAQSVIIAASFAGR